jgi:hypothetical protein
MRSPLQSDASRKNGALSRGPATPQGKAIAARNSTRHGLHSKSVLIAGEDPALYQSLLEDLIARYQPADTQELIYVEQMAAALWRQQRTERIEVALLNRLLCAGQDDPESARLAAFNMDLETLHRHQERLNRAHHRAANALLRLRKNHPNEPGAQDEALPENVSNEPDPPEEERAKRGTDESAPQAPPAPEWADPSVPPFALSEEPQPPPHQQPLAPAA